jgi:hypothetical protein
VDKPELSFHLHPLHAIDVCDQLVVRVIDQPELDWIAALNKNKASHHVYVGFGTTEH